MTLWYVEVNTVDTKPTSLILIHTQILNPKWNAYLTDVLVPRIQKEMAITTTFKASLYKLLLYKSGSFFKPHRDTEKEERMFGTLVIQLPSRFNGGQLVVEHDKKTKTIDFSSNVEAGNEFGTFFSSFYCDCKHEILPVSGGTRMCLVYNLVMDVVDGTSSIVPTAPVLRDIDVQLANICDEWKKANAPTKIVYGLSHKYTERSISLESLKSTDKVVAEALVKLSEERSLAGKWISSNTNINHDTTIEIVSFFAFSILGYTRKNVGR